MDKITFELENKEVSLKLDLRAMMGIENELGFSLTNKVLSKSAKLIEGLDLDSIESEDDIDINEISLAVDILDTLTLQELSVVFKYGLKSVDNKLTDEDTFNTFEEVYNELGSAQITTAIFMHISDSTNGVVDEKKE